MSREFYKCAYCDHDGSDGYNIEIELLDNGQPESVSIVCRRCKMISFDSEFGAWDQVAQIK